MSTKRGNRVTREQLITMLDYLAANPGLAEGRTRALMGKKEEMKKWEEMAALLHAADGPEKTVSQWQVVWRDLKSRTNIKVKECRARMARGENISSNSTFTDLELRVVDILGAEDVENSKDRKTGDHREKRRRTIQKFESIDEDSYDDPLTMQHYGEEEFVDDEDYAESTRMYPSKRLKPENYAAVANALHNSARSSIDGPNPSQSQHIKQNAAFTENVKSNTSYQEIIEIPESDNDIATIQTVQANAMMMQAEAAKISAEAAKMNAEAAKMYASAAKSNADALNKIAEAIRLAAEAFSRRYE